MYIENVKNTHKTLQYIRHMNIFGRLFHNFGDVQKFDIYCVVKILKTEK